MTWTYPDYPVDLQNVSDEQELQVGRTMPPTAATRGFMEIGRACRSILDVRNECGWIGTVQFRDDAMFGECVSCDRCMKIPGVGWEEGEEEGDQSIVANGTEKGR